MNKKERTGLETFASMLTIFLAFVIVCAGSVYLLIGIGVMNVDWLYETSDEASGPSSVIAGNGVFGDYSEMGFDESDVAAVLTELPFYDNYFIQSYAAYFGRNSSESTGGNIKMEAYDIYKSGDKYKIITYDSRFRVIGEVICDGEKVYVSDVEAGVYDIYPISESLSFSLIAPIPDFSVFKTGKYDVTDYSMSDDKTEYVIKCYMSDMKMTDEIHIGIDTGVISHFASTVGGVIVYDYSIGEYIGDYDFSPTAFDIPTSE